MLSDRMRHNKGNAGTVSEYWLEEVAALESDVRVAYGKMNVLIQREKARDKLVAALEAQVAGLRGEWEKEEYRCSQCGTGNPRLPELEAQITRLRKYARHKNNCPVSLAWGSGPGGTGITCECGFDPDYKPSAKRWARPSKEPLDV